MRKGVFFCVVVGIFLSACSQEDTRCGAQPGVGCRSISEVDQYVDHKKIRSTFVDLDESKEPTSSATVVSPEKRYLRVYVPQRQDRAGSILEAGYILIPHKEAVVDVK